MDDADFKGAAIIIAIGLVLSSLLNLGSIGVVLTLLAAGIYFFRDFLPQVKKK